MFERFSIHGSSRLMLCAVVLSTGLLGGCVVAPAGPYVVGTPVAYSAAPVYAPAPYYGYGYGYGYGWPAVSIGLYGSWGGHGGWRHRGWRH